ncbi:unnamed protein product [Prunus armeniaca]
MRIYHNVVTSWMLFQRIYPNAMCEDVGCELSEDLSQCDHSLGIKKPKLEIILPDITYAFFLSHSQGSEGNQATLGQGILAERVSLYDEGKRDYFHLERMLVGQDLATSCVGYLSLGYSTPFLLLGASYMYLSLAAAKAAVISVGEEIVTLGLPSRICLWFLSSPVQESASASGTTKAAVKKMHLIIIPSFENGTGQNSPSFPFSA